MNIVKVESLEDSISFSLEKISNQVQNKEAFKVALTGGRFGKEFIKSLSVSSLDIASWIIFQTDERLLSHKNDVIQRMLLNSLSTSRGSEGCNFHFFNPNVSAEESFFYVANTLDQYSIKELDLCLLSLGEDGHLAGHFEISETLLDKRFCGTDSAPKLPQNRVSFDIKWLSQSKEVWLFVLGEAKQEALKRLMDGRGLHSQNLAKGNITVITDLDIY